jgi:hypothetical protein
MYYVATSNAFISLAGLGMGAVAAVLVASVAQLLTSERVAPAAAAVAAVPKAHRIANLRVTTDLNQLVVEVV